MKSRFLIVMAVVVCASGAAAYAHHSFAGTYIEDQRMTIEGKVVEFNIRNPHSFINIEVVGADGKVVRWGAEWGGVTQLSNDGVTRFTLKVGDKVVIEGAPPRDSLDKKILVRQVVKPATATSPEFRWGGRVQ
jgi:hypothetical protein